MNEKKVTLLRDYSRASERAEKMLIDKKVSHVSVFCPSSDGVLPKVIDSHAVYSGLNGVVNYLRVCKRG